jgi:hypothetical protein
MVSYGGRNLTLTPGMAEQVAALPVIRPERRHPRNSNVIAQAGPSRNQVFFFVDLTYYFLSLNILK